MPGSTAIRPAILLPHADEVIRIGGIAREHRLDLGATVQHAGRDDAVASGRERRKAGSTNRRVGLRGFGRAHVDRVRTVAFGGVALGEHQRLGCGIGGVAMIGIGALVPEPIHGDRSRRTRARRVGNRDIERTGRLVGEAVIVRIGRDLGQHRRAFDRRGREEMRVRRRWNQETADGVHAGAAARLIGEGLEGEPGARPAEEVSRIERVDIGLERGDEIVIERDVVILDDCHRLRPG